MDGSAPSDLEIRGLSAVFDTARGAAPAVDDVSFVVPAGRMVCLVGESGCGKSVTARAILRLLPSPPGRITAGEIIYDGRDLLKLGSRAMRDIRGDRISMIFQEPRTSLNPLFTIGEQIGEVLRLHRGLSRRAARTAAIDMLRLVRIADPERRIDEYPHRLSGGMQQRVMIAIALACRPAFLIADEPTTALDVTIQAQILEILDDLRREIGMGVLLITHDLGVVAERADHVLIMYAGRIVESAAARTLFKTPLHPYTAGLLSCLPAPGKEGALPFIPGIVPGPFELPQGCRFRDRCPLAGERCAAAVPALREVQPGHFAACHFAETLAERRLA